MALLRIARNATKIADPQKGGRNLAKMLPEIQGKYPTGSKSFSHLGLGRVEGPFFAKNNTNGLVSDLSGVKGLERLESFAQGGVGIVEGAVPGMRGEVGEILGRF